MATNLPKKKQIHFANKHRDATAGSFSANTLKCLIPGSQLLFI